jgi:hypothetical protein
VGVALTAPVVSRYAGGSCITRPHINTDVPCGVLLVGANLSYSDIASNRALVGTLPRSRLSAPCDETPRGLCGHYHVLNPKLSVFEVRLCALMRRRRRRRRRAAAAAADADVLSTAKTRTNRDFRL